MADVNQRKVETLGGLPPARVDGLGGVVHVFFPDRPEPDHHPDVVR